MLKPEALSASFGAPGTVPRITVAGIAGPGDTLATRTLEAFRLITRNSRNSCKP
jgi:hypothetical protein